MALSVRHQQFVNEYLKTWNATEAYRRAYNCSYTTANSNGSKLLVNTSISEAIQQRIDENAMTADEVLTRLAEHARSDHTQYIIASPRLDLVRLAKDGKADLIPEFINEKGEIDIVKHALSGRLTAVAEYIIESGYVNLSDMERDGKKHLIKGIKPTQWGNVIEFHDAQAALVHIGKHHKLFTDKQEIDVKGAVLVTVDR